MRGARSTSALLVVLTTAALLSGCAGPAKQAGPAPSAPSSGPSSFAGSSEVVTVPVDATSTSEAISKDSGSSKNLSARELARIKAQLDAMQKEIDSLKMPTDDDFNSAAGDLY
jgi:TolA-binding protein